MTVQFATTLPYFSEPTFAQAARYLAPAYAPEETGGIRFEASAVGAILAAATRSNVLVLDSVSKASLVAAALIALWPARLRPRIVMHGEMWNPDTGLRFAAERRLVRLADRAIDRYIVLSSEEVLEFPRTWGLKPGKVVPVPFFWTLKETDLCRQVSRGSYVFAGGNSHRDYSPLIEAARRLPDVDFILATNRVTDTDLPPNVRCGPVTHDRFMDLLAGAGVVVVPMRRDLRRSAGQQTYLNAMLLGKPVIVTSVWGAADHIDDGVTGLIVDGSAESYERALTTVLDPARTDMVSRMCSDGATVARERFTFERHAQGIVAVVSELAQATSVWSSRYPSRLRDAVGGGAFESRGRGPEPAAPRPPARAERR